MQNKWLRYRLDDSTREMFRTAAMLSEHIHHLSKFGEVDDHSPFGPQRRTAQLLNEPLIDVESHLDRIQMPDDTGQPKRIAGENASKKKLGDWINAEIERIANAYMERAFEFLEVAEYGNGERLQEFIDWGFPVNFADPRSGETALHIAAGCGARETARALIKSGKCDYLLRDKFGRLASELAFRFGNDLALSRLLRTKELRQAEKQGIAWTRRPEPAT